MIEKPPFFMKDNGVTVIHVSTKTAEVRSGLFPADRSHRRYRQRGLADQGRPVAQPRLGFRPHPRPITRPELDHHRQAGRRTPASRSSRRILLPKCANACRATGSSASTTGSTRSGSRAAILPICPTPCCSTTRSPPWGAGLPSAMMSAMLYPERKVMAICGDGGFMMKQSGDGNCGPARPQSHRADFAR